MDVCFLSISLNDVLEVTCEMWVNLVTLVPGLYLALRAAFALRCCETTTVFRVSAEPSVSAAASVSAVLDVVLFDCAYSKLEDTASSSTNNSAFIITFLPESFKCIAQKQVF